MTPGRDGPNGVGTARVGCYPGSFDPPTIAHLAVATAALRTCRLDRVELVLAEVSLGKEQGSGPTVTQRSRVLRKLADTRPWLSVRVTKARLISDVAAGYDTVILGTDKWEQVVDVAWYGSERDRDAAVAALPRVALAPRARTPDDLPAGAVILDVALPEVSSTAVRQGRVDWMLPEASASGLW